MNPNKIVAGGSAGGGIGLLVAYVGSRLGWNLTAEDGAAIAVSATAVVAFIAHNGVTGIARIVWKGSGNQASPAA